MPVATLLKEGSVGPEVREIQSLLAAHGFDPGPADGVFGPLTRAAVIAFQTAKGLAIDGIVGFETRQALGQTSNPATPTTLVDLGHVAEKDFGLTVAECSAPGAPARWGPVHSGHSTSSLHFAGRAFDATGTKAAMDAFTDWVNENCAGLMEELIHNPNGSIDGGVHQDPSFWGDATWNGHRNHVHAAI